MPKKLRRSTHDRMIAGVCGGIAEYIGWDSTVLRLVWMAIVLITGFAPGVFLYLVAIFVVPSDV